MNIGHDLDEEEIMNDRDKNVWNQSKEIAEANVIWRKKWCERTKRNNSKFKTIYNLDLDCNDSEILRTEYVGRSELSLNIMTDHKRYWIYNELNPSVATWTDWTRYPINITCIYKHDLLIYYKIPFNLVVYDKTQQTRN